MGGGSSLSAICSGTKGHHNILLISMSIHTQMHGPHESVIILSVDL